MVSFFPPVHLLPLGAVSIQTSFLLITYCQLQFFLEKQILIFVMWEKSAEGSDEDHHILCDLIRFSSGKGYYINLTVF